MKTKGITPIFRAKNNSNYHTHTSANNIIKYPKKTTAILASLILLAAQARADVIGKKVAYESAHKQEELLEQFDRNNNVLLDNKEPKDINKNLISTQSEKIKQNSEPTKTETSQEKIQHVVELLNLLKGFNENGTKPQTKIDRSNNQHKAVFIMINEIEKLKELNQISNNSIATSLTKIDNQKALMIIKKALVEYRFKNLPPDFVPIQDFCETSGFYVQDREGPFYLIPTNNYIFNYDYFNSNVDNICKNPKLKKSYADNLVYYMAISNIKYIDNPNYSRKIIKLLFPE